MSSIERLQTLTVGKSNSSNGSSRFRFTLDSPTALTEEQREFYETNGYMVMRDLVSSKLLDECSQRFRDICDGRVDRGRIAMVKDVSLAKAGAQGERLYNKIQDFMWDDVLFQYCSDPSGTSRHPLHQDLHYFPFRPADRIVCAWTAMEKVTKENGCLVVLPGTHHGTLQPHDYPQWENGVNRMYHGIVGFDGHNRIHLTMEKGDTVFFHPILIHGSGTNRTQGFRKAISCHYAASECAYIDVKGTTQENIAKEVEEIANKRGTPMDYRDLWRYRSRLVSGVTANL